MRKRTLAIVAAITFLISTLCLLADTYPRQKGVKITHYTFDVTLSDTSDEIVMKESVDVDFLEPGIEGIDLDLCGPHARGAAPAVPGDPCVARAAANALSGQANPAATAGSTGMTVTSASVRYTQKGDVLHLSLPSPSRAGQHAKFTIEYRGVPATGLRIANNKYNDRSFVSNDWPNLAHNWLATIDHISMKAPITMIVTAPAKYQVISNGLLVQQVDLANGMRRTTWDEKVPIPTWQFALAVAPYAVDYFGSHNGIQFSSWSFPQERDDSLRGFSQATLPVMEFFSNRIGPYSYEKLAHVEANGVGGGMELASSIFYGYRGQPGRQLIAHEMAHQWFGNSASESDWDDVWLSEGFATYFALLFTEHTDGRDAFVTGVKNSAQNAMRYALANPESTIVHKNLSNISQVIANNAQVYQGGAQVLHMLRGVLGTPTFWKGIQLYYSRFQNKNASSDDFRQAMQDACVANAPECSEDNHDLTWFFRQWLNRGGILQLDGSWSYNAAAKQLRVSVDQKQAQGLFRMPIQIEVGTATHRLVVDKAHNELTIPLDVEPASVRLDPGTWVTMMQSTFVKK